MPNEPEAPEKVDLHAYADSRLRDLIVADAIAQNITLSDVIIRILAAHYQRPDLAIVPKKPMGRPIGGSKEKRAAMEAEAAKAGKKKKRAD